ncbi:GDP-mannose 4,6-dehydratase [Staphylococcus sp. GDY8P29P]|uniref:GDP-mannose 4,6-dehydratase n=1 Tax=Staphylococcus sp. GDY8P29P TaxID=2804114 RepID=UPI001AEC5B02|nr:GDP-mannose 4,6-dehydratase [Staphylococcus sp. GDY8P29P]
MKILITGGAGFIGSHLAENFYNDNHEVFIVDNLSSGHRENINFIDDNHFFHKDVIDFNFIENLIYKENFHIIIHLAAVVNVVDTIKNPILSQKINTEATLNILECIRKHNRKIQRFIFASSAAIYGNTSSLPKKEDVYINPESPYAIQKYSSEQYAKIYYNLYNIPTTSLRFFNIFGPRQDPSSPYSGVISIMQQKFIEKEAFNFYGDGNQTRDFVYVKDLVSAINVIIENEESKGNIYNLGTQIPSSLKDIFEIFSDIYSSKIDYSFKKERKGDIKHSYANIEKLQQLGYKPRYNIYQGLKEYISDFNNQSSKRNR